MQWTLINLSKSKLVGIKHFCQATKNWLASMLPLSRMWKFTKCHYMWWNLNWFLGGFSSNSSEPTGELQSTTKHSQWVLLKTVKSRDLLLHYSGFTKDRKNPKQLTMIQFRQMLKLMRDEGATILADIVNRLFIETGQRTAPWFKGIFFWISW